MPLSSDKKVSALNFSQEDSNGLNAAIIELRRILGPVDAYVAIYTKNGMNGPTVIFGKKEEQGKDGRPFLAVRKIKGRNVLGFSMGGESDRQIIQKITGRPTWRQVIDKETFPLESISLNSGPFASKMEKLGKKLKSQHHEFYERRLAGKSRMPSSYMDTVTAQPHGANLLKDIQEINELKSLSSSTRKQLIDARVGQGKFRAQVLKKWGNRCAVTGCEVQTLLRASHIQPWAYQPAPNQLLPGIEQPRLDPSNGLPLIPTLDALFDSGLMTFDENGKAHFSDTTTQEVLKELHIIPKEVRLRHAPNSSLSHYLRIHHIAVFKGSPLIKKMK